MHACTSVVSAAKRVSTMVLVTWIRLFAIRHKHEIEKTDRQTDKLHTEITEEKTERKKNSYKRDIAIGIPATLR